MTMLLAVPTPPPPPPPPPPRNVRHVLRIVGWNLLFIVAGLLLIALVGEAYFRSSGRFDNIISGVAEEPPRWSFVPGVGPLRPPRTELIFHPTDADLRTVQRANSIGFLDRDPIDPSRADESCHIAIIGDSFVEGREVHISDKMQVQLEEIAAHEAPNLDVTVSAYGIMGTGQVNQLPFYDRYARHMNPNIVVLVFYTNDVWNNSATLSLLMEGYRPEHPPFLSAHRVFSNSIELTMPDPKFEQDLLVSTHAPWMTQAIRRISKVSQFARWIRINTRGFRLTVEEFRNTLLSARVAYLMNRPEYAYLFNGWIPNTHLELHETKSWKVASEIFREGWGFTSFGLEQFKRRADHDGAALMVLVTSNWHGESDQRFLWLSSIAESLDIPVVSQHDYIVSQGGSVEDARWDNDFHWTPAGHRWAAEAIWEHIGTEWQGKCPEAEPQPDITVDWIPVGYSVDEYEGSLPITVEEPLGLHHRFHTPEGEASVQSFPTFDLEEYRTVQDSIASVSPIARSEWDVHLFDDGLTYVKEPCVPHDIENIFFLHVVPEDESGLPQHPSNRGFDNLDFYFGIRGAMFDGLCMVSTDLPEYDIASIRTGQFSDGVQTWRVDYNFALPSIMDMLRDIQQSGIEPEIRSDFDVYIDDGLLVYVNESCDADDRDLPFFLHVFPADENDLAEGREESGFDNLGFELMQNGGESDGVCFATVDLPRYEISSIRTGQWVRGQGNVWEASIEFAE